MYTEEEEQEIFREMDEAMKQLAEEENKKYVKDQETLKLVQSKVSKKVFKDIKFSLEESENTYNYLITDKPKGNYQTESEFEELEGQWVNQTTNGGFTGDEFAGTVSIKLNEKEYFQFSYYM